MSLTNSRWVIVDDLDRQIDYSGEWRTNSAQVFAQLGNYGKPFGSTVHSTSSGTAGFSFKFDGADGAILGTVSNGDLGALEDPSWECFVDGNKVQSLNATLSLRNNQKFCQWTNTPMGRHTLTVNVTSAKLPFIFDRIIYAPSPSHTSNQELVSIDYIDPMFKFGSSWQEVNSNAMMTSEKGANLTVAFSGTTFSWYGLGLSVHPTASSNATYQIDGGEPSTFVLADLGPSGIPNPRFNELLFEVHNLQPGDHSITVTYEGDSTVRPLALTSVVVQNHHEVIQVQVQTTAPNKAVPVGVIIGAVLGGFFAILAIILGLFWYRFNRKRSYQQASGRKGVRQEIDPFYVDVSSHKIIASDFPDESEPLTGVSRSTSMLGLDKHKHLIDPFAIPERPSTPPRRPQSGFSRDSERYYPPTPSRTPSFDILLSPPPPNVRSSGIMVVRMRSDDTL